MGNWQLDPFHTQIEFSAKHLGMMTVRGHFAEFSAEAEIDPDKPESASVQITIQTASIRTNNDMRDNDIRGANFLDVEHFPTMTFASTSVEPAGQDTWTLHGDLTIKGTTHPVALAVTKYGEFNDPGMMGHRIGYSAAGQINRRDFGVTFSAMLDGKWVVSDDIRIMIEGELVERKPADAEQTAQA